MKPETAHHLDSLMKNHPELAPCTDSITAAFDIIAAAFGVGGTLLAAGNGGSAADCEHITGELMKAYLKQRPVPPAFAAKLGDPELAARLAGALPAISLPSQTALLTAVANDESADMIFAQAVYGYGRKGDVLLAISTSGRSRNIINALEVARAQGMATVGLTGKGGGAMGDRCDALVMVPADATPAVQELHVPVYHTLCAMLEEEFF